jgi:hypothetical protein
MSDYRCPTSCVYSLDAAGAPFANGSGLMMDTFRINVDASLTDQIKLSFEPELVESSRLSANVLTAAARFELSDEFNIWVGRFTPPSDRANLYGPFYANDWAPYADDVADAYPYALDGFDDGIAYWGQFGLLKVQLGVFDGKSLNSAVHNKTLLTAARVTADFWDIEPGYYLNGTTYGEQDLLALGLAAQTEDGRSAYSADGLFAKKLAHFGVVTVEAEYQKDRGLTSAASSHGWYALGGYLFPRVIAIGKVQLLGKYSQKITDTFQRQELNTTEVDLNYIIHSFSARIGLYYLRQAHTVPPSVELQQAPPTPSARNTEYGLKIQIRM